MKDKVNIYDDDEYGFLVRCLEPIQNFLLDNTISEISCNVPGGVWIERNGIPEMEYHPTCELTDDRIQLLAEQVANHSNQMINNNRPLLSASLPTGERIQFVLPPCASEGPAFSIRKQTISDLSLEDFEEFGTFSQLDIDADSSKKSVASSLREAAHSKQWKKFFYLSVISKKNVVISGGTSSGKTTFLNALGKIIPESERIVTIEDTRELSLIQKNQLNLLASKGSQGRAQVDVIDLMEASLRLRPDRILLGELRGKEAYTFLRAINTGHPGSLTTLHADSPKGAFEQLALMIMQSDIGLDINTVQRFTRSIIDIVIQLKREGGVRRVTDVYIKNG